MRKIIIICLFFLLCNTLSACDGSRLVGTTTNYQMPYGKWHNSTIGLTLDIQPVESGPFFGTYVINDNVVDVIIYFGHERAFIVYDSSAYDMENDRLLEISANSYFNGAFNVRDDKLYYSLKPLWREKTGIQGDIVFEKTEEIEIPE